MLFLRLRQCEVALAGGRLDEAFEVASRPDVRGHRRGQAIVDRLIRALLERGRGHLAAGRIAEAISDTSKAVHLGGNMAEVAQLRAAVERADAGRRERAGAVERGIAAARRLVAAGQLTAVGEVLGTSVMQGDGRAEALLWDAAARKGAVERGVAAGFEALKRDDWQGAMDQVSRARAVWPGGVEIRELSRRVAGRVAEEVNGLVEAGRLDAAETVLGRAGGLDGAELETLRQAVERCRAAAESVQSGRFGEAREMLVGLARIWPGARWISESIRNLQGVGEALEGVRGGPLGLIAAGAREASTMAMRMGVGGGMKRDISNRADPGQVRGYMGADSRDERFLLQVDGVGSFPVFRARSVRVGPVSGGGRPDVGLLTDAGAPTVTITRSDEDYFLQSATPVMVNDRPVTSKLLCDGDRIALGPRCRIGFSRPNAASASAVLEISGARLGRGDVRRIILMDREIVLGDASSAHVRTRELRGPAVLLAGRRGLTLKADETISVGEHPAGRLADIAPGQHVRVGSLGLVVTQG